MRQITFSGLMAKMVAMPEKIEAGVAIGLTKCAVEVQKTAVAKFGEYQPAVGPYPEWQLLTLDTLHKKMDLAGANGPDPLIGHYPPGEQNSIYPVPLKQSITMEVDEAAMIAQVGTNDPVGEWQEFGTTRGIPPRPFLRPALYEKEDFIKKTLDEAIGLALFSKF
ncbi:MAG: hypothetical protein M1609_06475 [Firmicutes bacterium]|nr:hypothetical protein [Bacillota bacterium]